MSSASSASLSSLSSRIPVALLGATGTVGQRFIVMLAEHPVFELVCLAASNKSASKRYRDAVSWKLAVPCPDRFADMNVVSCTVDEVRTCGNPIVAFSALDADVAGEIEKSFAAASFRVFSNARNYRYDGTVPILIPYVNASHLSVIPLQQKKHGFPQHGYIVTNANCSSTGLVVVLKPLMERFGLDKVFVTTLQAISGAGYPGVPSLDITDNVVPYISGEEEKMELEPRKILGQVSPARVDTTAATTNSSTDTGAFEYAEFTLSAMCNRVNVVDGHSECVSIKFRTPGVTVDQVIDALKAYTSEAQSLKLHSAAPAPIVVIENDPTRPQPRLDRDRGGGMVVTVGRVRKCNLFDIKLSLVSHNTVIGAAGGSILNAELAHAKGKL